MKSTEPREALLALLGLARKAGKLAVGARAVEQMVRRGRRPIVILARDAGASQLRRMRRLDPVRGFVDGEVSRDELAQRLGRQDLSVVAVAAPGFVAGIVRTGLVEPAKAGD